MKKCYKCGKTKQLKEFSKNRAKRNGHTDECKPCRKLYRLESIERLGIEDYRNYRYGEWSKKTYGVTIEWYLAQVGKQGNRCAICNREETSTCGNKVRRLAVDHNHITKQVRELLCSRCNSLLGFANDSIELLQAIINYLRKHQGGEN